jgi:quercetin dioxygenase-like cupin family protein
VPWCLLAPRPSDDHVVLDPPTLPALRRLVCGKWSWLQHQGLGCGTSGEQALRREGLRLSGLGARVVQVGGRMTQPFVIPPDGGRATWTDGLILFKAVARDTGGALSVWESLMPRGSSPPLHVHEREDEAFYVLEGEMTFRVGDDHLPAPAGTFVWGPRDVAHQYRVESSVARLLTWFVPAGGEELFFHMSRPAEARTLPPASGEPSTGPTAEQVAMFEQRYGQRVLGPPMGPSATP